MSAGAERLAKSARTFRRIAIQGAGKKCWLRLLGSAELTVEADGLSEAFITELKGNFSDCERSFSNSTAAIGSTDDPDGCSLWWGRQ